MNNISSIAQIFWMRRYDMMNYILIRYDFISEYLMMIYLRRIWEIDLFYFPLDRRSRNELDDLSIFIKISKIIIFSFETSSK